MSYFSLTIKFNEEKKVPLKILGLEREDYNKFLLEGEFIFNSRFLHCDYYYLCISFLFEFGLKYIKFTILKLKRHMKF